MFFFSWKCFKIIIFLKKNISERCCFLACSSRVSTVHACYSTYVIKLQRRTKKKRKNGERKQGNEEQGREKRVNSLKKKEKAEEKKTKRTEKKKGEEKAEEEQWKLQNYKPSPSSNSRQHRTQVSLLFFPSPL